VTVSLRIFDGMARLRRTSVGNWPLVCESTP
jgi:hypothetical protein